jgi:hypothetical protein
MQKPHPVTPEGPKAWRWYSCRCHDPRMLAGDDDYKRPRWMDACLEGHGDCSAWPRQCPESCMVGAMGFLLTCRQA